MQPSGAARLFQNQILQAAAGQTTTAEQSTTAMGQLPGNPATSTTVPVMGHGMDVDVPSIAAFQNHPPAHIMATVCHGAVLLEGLLFVRYYILPIQIYFGAPRISTGYIETILETREHVLHVKKRNEFRLQEVIRLEIKYKIKCS